MNGHKALPGECTRKTVTLAPKSASWLTVTGPSLLLPSFVSFPLISSPLLFFPLLCAQQGAADQNTNTHILSLFIEHFGWGFQSLTFQQVSCQTRFCPRGPNKVWQDRVHVQSHVIMCVRCPQCSGGLGGRQPSRCHLKKRHRFIVNPFQPHF